MLGRLVHAIRIPERATGEAAHAVRGDGDGAEVLEDGALLSLDGAADAPRQPGRAILVVIHYNPCRVRIIHRLQRDNRHELHDLAVEVDVEVLLRFVMVEKLRLGLRRLVDG